MIFYFTGTGNSYDAAMRLKGENEEVYNMTDLVWNKIYKIDVADGEKVGFVFPVYFGGLPSVVRKFISKVRFSEQPEYMYTVITCGANAYAASKQLSDRLNLAGYNLDAAYTVVMPDNYVLMYSIASEEKQAKVLSESEKKIEDIKNQIASERKTDVNGTLSGRIITALMYPFYKHGRKTKKFFVDNTCIGCGKCAKRCPSKAIVMRDGKPKWEKKQCVHCVSCMRCNAIQYGKRTAKRRRYVNPSYK